MEIRSFTTKLYVSPCGPLLLGACGEELCLCDWVDSPHHANVMQRMCRQFGPEVADDGNLILMAASRQLDEYFAGQRKEFDIRLAIKGTPFRQAVWQTLLTISYGSTETYSDIASRVASRAATRAVASAIGANPLSLFIPCHRVIGTNGKLTGYAGGLKAKEYLLDLETDNSVNIC